MKQIITLFVGLFFLTIYSVNAQESLEKIPGVYEYILENMDNWELQESDLSDLAIKDDYTSKRSGARHLYIVQQYNGIEIYNAMLTLTLKPDGDVLTGFSRLLPELEQKIVGHQPIIDSEEAVINAFADVEIGLQKSDLLQLPNRSDQLVFEAEKYSRTEIPVKLVYQPMEDGTLELCYDLSFHPHSDINYWNIRVSALDGQVADKISWTVECNMDLIPSHQHSRSCFHHNKSTEKTDHAISAQFRGEKRNRSSADSGIYRVIPFPYESPIHGDFELVVNPSDDEFSPLGWHSIEEGDGPDFTYTRGNNVHAFVDRVGNFSPDLFVDGGDSLIFDFPFDQDLEPEGYQEASVTNLFYWNNILHEFSYAYGFDEAAGNFQFTNLTGAGNDGDPVNAIAQSRAEGLQSVNNASFSSPPDGNSGTMNMFVWTRNSADASLLNVEEPADVAGSYETGTASFGDPIGEDPIISEAVFVNDGVGVVTDGCQPIQNASEISGKIAMIDRGICEFGVKVLAAEQAGAIAVIICNNRSGGAIGMAPGAVGDQVTIPSVFISQEDCAIIRGFAGEGLKIRLQRPEVDGPSQYDASLDNGIIAHEFAHGVSIRLTGGPSSTGCLTNVDNGDRSDGEQMGEGWSDFFTLITSVREGDTKFTNRGVGNYVIRNAIDQRGIRTFPYNYNMDINPVTYYDTYDASVPHGVGHVWASVLWDLFWDMVDVYGFDSDWYRGNGGNNMAIQLVMDGMKLQPCNPGFVDGRDAILAADQLLYDGANQCLIWSTFARRGLGVDADQGSPFIVRDAKESYDIPATCIQTVKINKVVTPLIEAGESIDVELTVVNHKAENPTGLVIEDEIPEGTSVVMSSLPAGATIDGNKVIIPLEEGLEYNVPQTFNYQLDTEPSLFSELQFREDNEDNPGNQWIEGSTIGTDVFRITDTDAFSGNNSIFVPNTDQANDQNISYFTPIQVKGEFPVMRFAHRYNTEVGTDGGLVTVSNDGLTTLIDLGYAMFRNEYSNRISGNTFSQGDLNAFTGQSNGWTQTYIDMSDFIDQTLFLQFRFGSDNNMGGEGWYIDDIEIFDAVNYNSEAIVLSDDGIEASAEAEGRGTIVEPSEPVDVDEKPEVEAQLTLFPNPAQDMLNISLQNLNTSEADIIISDMSGKRIYREQLEGISEYHRHQVDISKFPVGIYNLTMHSSNGVSTHKFVKF